MYECAICQNKAEFYIPHTLLGKSGNTYICDKCLVAFDKSGYLKLFAVPVISDSILPTTPTDIECKSCGMTLSKFLKTKRVGCAEDYRLFGLQDSLESYHKASQHIGKIPINANVSKEVVIDRIERLKNLMGDAVRADRFEEAAKIRDEIKALSTKIGLL